MQLPKEVVEISKEYFKCCCKIEQDPDEEDDSDMLGHLTFRESEGEWLVK